MKLKNLFVAFGGDNEETIGKFIGSSGKKMFDLKSEGGMGFKELSLFNDALLSKQTWRLLHNTNSFFFTKCLSPSSSQTVLLWKPMRVIEGHMLGGVF